MLTKKILFFCVVFFIAGSCVVEKDSVPYKNFISYAFEAVVAEKVVGVGHLNFFIEGETGFIFYNLFTIT